MDKEEFIKEKAVIVEGCPFKLENPSENEVDEFMKICADTIISSRTAQVEKMAKIMCEQYGTPICDNECVISGKCANRYLAEKLYNAGYRKQSDTVREFVERLKNEYLSKEGNFVYWVIDVDDIAKVAKEYGVELEK